jgi:hypothetical protein
MQRFAAKLLFQFRVMVDGVAGKRRLCEERIVVILAEDGRKALAVAKRRGQEAEYRYTNDQGNPVFFEFVGIMDLQGLGPECAQDEVWYDIKERLLPMERRDSLLPQEAELNAIRNCLS